METWIHDACKKRALRQLIAWALISVVIIYLLISNSIYWANFFNGPYVLNESDLSNVHNPQAFPQQFVVLTGRNIVDTGIQQLTTKATGGVKPNTVEAKYYALIIGDKFLMVKSILQPSTTVVGNLAPIPFELSNQLFSDPEIAALRSKMYPFYLETDSYRQDGYIVIGILAFFVLLLLRFAVPTWNYYQTISNHPLIKRINTWNNRDAILRQVQEEMNGTVKIKDGSSIITENYVIDNNFFYLKVFRFDDLLWVHKKITKHSVNFIPTGKTFSVIFYFYGGSQIVSGNQEKVDKLIAYASARAPWAVIGYSAELNQAFTKDTANFCAAVEARRR